MRQPGCCLDRGTAADSTTQSVLVGCALSALPPQLHRTPPHPAPAVTLEFTVNEQWDAKYNSTERRSFEQLLRRLLARKRPPAVVILHHYAWWYSPGDGVDRGLFYREPESALSVFSNVSCGLSRYITLGRVWESSPCVHAVLLGMNSPHRCLFEACGTCTWVGLECSGQHAHAVTPPPCLRPASPCPATLLA